MSSPASRDLEGHVLTDDFAVHGVENPQHQDRGYNDQDVLCGRGTGVFRHPGNQTHRRLVQMNQALYAKQDSTKEKANISRSIVAAIRKESGRFLARDPNLNTWYDIGDKKATEKTSQALREVQPDIRREMRENLQQQQQHHDTQELVFAQKRTRMEETTPRDVQDEHLSFRHRYERLKDMYNTLLEDARTQRNQLAEKDVECCMLASNYQQSEIQVERLQREKARFRMHGGDAINDETGARYEWLLKKYETKRQCNAHLKAQLLTFQRECAVQTKKRKVLQEKVTSLKHAQSTNQEYYQRRHEDIQYQLEETKLELQNVYRELASKNRLLAGHREGISASALAACVTPPETSVFDDCRW